MEQYTFTVVILILEHIWADDWELS